MTAGVTPVRYPDLRSVPLMTKRAGWLVVLNFLIPGSAQVLAGSRRLGRFALGATLVFWIIAVVTIAIALLDRNLLIGIATNPVVLWIAIAALVFYAVLWIVLTLDTLRLVKFVRLRPLGRTVIGIVAIAGLVVSGGGALWGAVNGSIASGVLGSVFGDGNIAAPVDGRYNILLLGGDAGPDRTGLRPDSISVASIDAETGATSLFGIPRNLQRAPFVEGSPLYSLYPTGFDCGDDCLIDYVYQVGLQHPELYPDAEKNGSTPAIEAVRDAAEGVTGLTIQYYVLIDMQGFAQLIDALGGIDIDVPDRTPIGSNNYDDGSKAPPIGYIEKGPQHMDGQTALWYGRTRYGSSDYARMARQRQVQEAILAQMEPANVLSKFQGVAEAGQQVVSTDIPQPMLAHFVDLAGKARTQPVTSLNFVPPDWDPVYPDFAAIHAKVKELNTPVTPSPSP